uniref:Uncharacterized protein n=1 Tax=Macrostomum lignano TaxID=282301 RepID=A0A1I8JPQ6_9PLAT
MHPHVYERREMIVNLTQSSAAVDTSCLSYFLVRSLPKLLELPHLDCFVDGSQWSMVRESAATDCANRFSILEVQLRRRALKKKLRLGRSFNCRRVFN